MPEAVNRHEIRVTGMSRSGNHAVINWILSQAAGRTCFLNCVEPKSNPFETARPLDRSGKTWLANYPGFDVQRERRGEFSRKDYLILSHEDCFLGMVATGRFEQEHDALVGTSARRTDVLVLRDPYNLFASRLKSGYGGITPLTEVRMWKQHARAFVGERRILPGNFLPVSYNAWTADAGYRRRLARRLGLPDTDTKTEAVARTGGGSSFDGLRFAGRASRMKVFDRWRHFAHDPRYRRRFDAEIAALSERIFGRLPAAETLAPHRRSRAIAACSTPSRLSSPVPQNRT